MTTEKIMECLLALHGSSIFCCCCHVWKLKQVMGRVGEEEEAEEEEKMGDEEEEE